MTRRAPARMRPAVDAAPRVDAARSDTPALTSGGFTALLESAAQEYLERVALSPRIHEALAAHFALHLIF